MMWILRFLMIALAGGLMLLNLQPFLDVSAMLLSTISDIPFWGLITAIPLIGPLFQFIGKIAPDAFGVALWLTIQFIEILPSWMKGDLSVMDSLIKGIGRHSRQAITGSDSQPVIDLKTEYNKAPQKWMAFADTMAIVAYVVEALLSFLRFPPYKGGFLVFWEDVQSGLSSIDNVDWGNLLNALATMFGFELLLAFVIWVLMGMRYFMPQSKPEPYYEAPASGSGSSGARRVTR